MENFITLSADTIVKVKLVPALENTSINWYPEVMEQPEIKRLFRPNIPKIKGKKAGLYKQFGRFLVPYDVLDEDFIMVTIYLFNPNKSLKKFFVLLILLKISKIKIISINYFCIFTVSN